MSTFVTTRTVRFSHCDPAGIIFYPRYFDLIHEAKEDWFRDALGYPFAHMLGTMQQGFPIARLEADVDERTLLIEVVQKLDHAGRRQPLAQVGAREAQ